MILRFILLVILFIIVARAFWRVVDGVIEGASGRPRREVRPGMKLVRDPVCGTHIVPGAHSLTSGGTTYYFCSEACRDKYRRGARA